MYLTTFQTMTPIVAKELLIIIVQLFMISLKNVKQEDTSVRYLKMILLQ